jgi:hypothetical protein
MDDFEVDSGIPADLERAYGKIFGVYFTYRENKGEIHDSVIEELAKMFDVNKDILDNYIKDNLHRAKNDKTFFPDVDEEDNIYELSEWWNGFCPESWLMGKRVRMRLNRSDFFESEATGLQMVVFRGAQAIILNFRGKGDFRTTADFADDIVNGEVLCPQTMASFPFNDGAIFSDRVEIEKYIKEEVK